MIKQDKTDKQTLVLFDFDGTITRGDTMLAYTKFVCGLLRYLLGIVYLMPMLIRFRLGRLDHTDAKESWLTYFLGNKSVEELQRKGELFCQTVLPKMLRSKAVDRLKWHQAKGHHCMLVTASLDIWTRAWAQENGLELISSKGQVSNNLLTGRLEGENCWGQEKRRRVEELIDTKSYQYIYAYGDSKGDQAILDWADHASYRMF